MRRRPHWLIEAKRSETTPSPSLRYYARKLAPAEPIQLVLTLTRARERSGIKVLPLGPWLEGLPLGA